MHGIREYNDKIKSLKNTRKITGSMKMVSTVKFQKFSRAKVSAVNFAQSVETAASDFFQFADPGVSGDQKHKTPVNKALVVFFTADRGLCGRYNTNVFRETLRLSEQLKSDNIETVFCCSGSKGATYLSRYKLQCEHFFNTAAANPDSKNAHEIARFCLNKYLTGEVDSIYIVNSQRKSSVSEEPVTQKVFPVEKKEGKSEQKKSAIHSLLLENNAEEMQVHLSQMKMFACIYRALIESAESEHSARMNAMETATTNCDKMIQNYQQLRNRARQTAITTELSEIVTGKEALEKK